MKYRYLGKSGLLVSRISLGTMTFGTPDWGCNEQESHNIIKSYLDAGGNFIDTADVYGDGRSERLIAQLLKERSEQVYVVTKAGRRLNPHVASGYNKENLTAFVERSLRNLDVETLDLVQLHCPPTDVYYMPETFDALEGLVQAGKTDD